MNQPLTVKGAVAVIGALLLLTGMVFGGRAMWKAWAARPKSAASVQNSVRSYLEEHASPKDFKTDYDFNLRATVLAAQTNAAQLRGEIFTLRTNLAEAQKELSMLTRAANSALEQQRIAKRVAGTIGQLLPDREKRLAAKEVELASVRTNAQNVQAIALAETTMFLAQTDVVTLRAKLSEKQNAFTNANERLDAAQAALTAKQSQVKSLRETLNEREATAAPVRRDVLAKEQALASQYQNFARQIRTNIIAAGSYEAIYTWIGRALWTADRLLSSSDFADQRSGAMLAEDAATYSIRSAENGWLAARICEAWVWPSLDKYDAPGKPKVALNQVLQTCADAFNRANETNNLVKNFRLRLQHASTPRSADGIRYSFANVLEQSGNFSEALEMYRAIQDTNYLGYAKRRIAAAEKRASKP